MSKYLIAIIMTLSMVSVSRAEMDAEDFGSKMQKWGVKIGGNFSSFSSKPVNDNLSGAFGILIGAYSRTPLSDMFLLQFEAGYSILGAKQKVVNTEYSLPVGYIDIEALIKFAPLEDLPGANIHAGLQYGYMVYAREGDLDRLNNYKASDLDILAGLGYELDSGVNIELRYLLGLNNIWNQKTTGIYNIWKNRAVQIQLGWTF